VEACGGVGEPTCSEVVPLLSERTARLSEGPQTSWRAASHRPGRIMNLDDSVQHLTLTKWHEPLRPCTILIILGPLLGLAQKKKPKMTAAKCA
jgi:hypothetical protein